MNHRPSTLVIDDDCDLRSALVVMLEAEGHVVVEAAHGLHALERLTEAAPQLIILDLTMPVMDGRAFLAEKAASDFSAIPVIVFSSSEQPGVESMPGVIGVVHKLAGVEALLACVKRAAAAEKLSPTETQIRQFADAMPQLAFIAGPDGYLAWYNARWYEYTGLTRAQTEGWGWQSVHDPAALALAMQRWRLSIATGQPFDMTFPLRGRDGRFRHFLTRVVPVRDPASGELLRWFGTNTDVEQQRQTIAERDEALASTGRALQKREEFLSVAAHELRTPLTSLRLRLQLIRAGLDRALPASTLERQSLDVAINQTTRLNALIEEMLDVSRRLKGGLHIDRASLDLGQLTEAVVGEHLLRFTADAKGFEVAAEGHVLVDGDRFHLEQLISNLLTNAVKYGAGKPIRISVTSDRGNARIEVADQGIGIAAENQTRIFERFERAVSNRNSSGLGLGLYIARQIAQAHGGTISVESALEKGSTFTLSMPLRH
jgi:PAS domain S-box-containing protein